MEYYLVNKPFGYETRFTGDKHLNLSHLLEENNLSISKDVYPVGRLDKDSEGLLILTNDKVLHTQLLDPKFGHKRSYWVQVDGQINEKATQLLRNGVEIRINKKAYFTKKAFVEIINEPEAIWKRKPPVRFRKTVPDSWINITLTEGKNRQVRRMTAKVGFPTLRLIRNAIEKVEVTGLELGKIIAVDKLEMYQKLAIKIF